MKKMETVKTVGGVILGLGVTSIVKGIVDSNVDTEDAGFVKKLCIGFAALVLGSMVADKVVTYAEEKLDEVAAKVTVEKVEEKPEEKKE